ncbi:L-ectoine synthase-like [Glandiceps talaboti]
MIVRHSEDVEITILPNTELQGKELIADSDGMSHSAYEISIDAKTMVNLKSPENPKLNHIYYCITGSGSIKTCNSQTYAMNPDQFIAMSSGVSAQLSAETRMRVYIVYCEDSDPSNDRIVSRSLNDVIGTERDIDWGHGYSRRLLLKKDGFPVSFHNTLCYGGHSSKLGYMNHMESAYYISGKTTYKWKEGEESVQTRIGLDSGTIYNMNEHDKHILVAEEDSVVLCVFYPALKGTETHNHDGGYSGFDV